MNKDPEKVHILHLSDVSLKSVLIHNSSPFLRDLHLLKKLPFAPLYLIFSNNSLSSISAFSRALWWGLPHGILLIKTPKRDVLSSGFCRYHRPHIHPWFQASSTQRTAGRCLPGGISGRISVPIFKMSTMTPVLVARIPTLRVWELSRACDPEGLQLQKEVVWKAWVIEDRW